jgi:drug/metabolite transporter (DMT)-like permease
MTDAPAARPAHRGLALAVAGMVASAACWGLAMVMTKGALAQVPPFTLLAIQLGASVGFLWAAAVTGARIPLGRRARRAAATGLLEPGLAYGVGVPGVALTTASNASVIGPAESAFILPLAWLLFGHRPGIRLALAILTAMAGVTLISLSDPGDLALGHAAGDLLVLAGTLFAAFYVVASSRLVGEFAPLPLAALQQTVGPGFALLLPAATLLLGWERPPAAIAPAALLLAVDSGVVQYALAIWLYLLGMKTLPAGIAGLFLALIPVFGVASAMVFLGETLAPLQWGGCALVIGAVLLIARR